MTVVLRIGKALGWLIVHHDFLDLVEYEEVAELGQRYYRDLRFDSIAGLVVDLDRHSGCASAAFAAGGQRDLVGTR